MNRIPKAVNKWWVFWPIFLTYVGLWAMPGEMWFKTRSLNVGNAVSGDSPIVIEDREIRWSFKGRYSTETRDAKTNDIAGGCQGSGDVSYKGGLSGPKTYNLVDHTDGKTACRFLTPGAYYTEVCRTILRPLYGILPAKTSCATSNIFTVEAPK